MWNSTRRAVISEPFPYDVVSFHPNYPAVRIEGGEWGLIIWGFWTAEINGVLSSLRDYDEYLSEEDSVINSKLAQWGEQLVGASLVDAEVVTSQAGGGGFGVTQFVFSCGWIEVTPEASPDSWILRMPSGLWVGY